MQGMLIVGFALAMLCLLTCGVVIAGFFRIWVRAFTSGAPVPWPCLIGMRLRGNPPRLLVDAYIALLHGGTRATIAEVEKVFIANRSQVMFADDLVRLVRQQHAKGP
jgi:uncharacterized protein YqfA (UPF0365 family)